MFFPKRVAAKRKLSRFPFTAAPLFTSLLLLSYTGRAGLGTANGLSLPGPGPLSPSAHSWSVPRPLPPGKLSQTAPGPVPSRDPPGTSPGLPFSGVLSQTGPILPPSGTISCFRRSLPLPGSALFSRLLHTISKGSQAFPQAVIPPVGVGHGPGR